MLAYIETMGCQMNKYDSELVAAILVELGYELVGDPKHADLIMVNTCSVRKTAENHAIGRLTQLGGLKYKNPNLKLAVIGCMAERMQKQLFRDIPVLDFVIGPDSYRNLPELLNTSAPKQLDTGNHPDETYDRIIPNRKGEYSAWIAISRGCDNWCSYCVVPIVRGPERSRKPDEIYNEVLAFIAQGGKEVTLLGQNVSTYRYEDIDFPALLKLIAKIDGLERLRFVTNHPRDIDRDLIDTIANLPKVCPFLHVPCQSGSNRILTAMNRGYTKEQYIEKLLYARSVIPELHLASDFIVGFPGETEEDFNDTLDVINQIKFEMAYTFIYNPRPGTAAAQLHDNIPREVKVERLKEVVKLISQYSLVANSRYLNQSVSVLLDERHPQETTSLRGRTPGNVIVNVKATESLLGKIVKVYIERVGPHSMNGSIRG